MLIECCAVAGGDRGPRPRAGGHVRPEPPPVTSGKSARAACGRSRNWTALRSSWTTPLEALPVSLYQQPEVSRRRSQDTVHTVLAAAFQPRARRARAEEGERSGPRRRLLLVGRTSGVRANYVSAYNYRLIVQALLLIAQDLERDEGKQEA